MRLTVDSERNSLRFSLADRAEGPTDRACPAVLDIGEAGHLVGLEVDLGGEPFYLEIEPDTSAHIRSAPATATVGFDAAGHVAAIEVPRRGHGYEITYPSGNR